MSIEPEDRIAKGLFGWKFALSYVCLFAVIFFFIRSLGGKIGSLEALRHISFRDLAVIAALNFTSSAVNAVSANLLIESFGVRMPFREWFGLSSITTALNYFFPARSGVVLRAWYMKKKYGFSYSDFTSVYLFFYLFSFMTIALFGIVLFAAIFFLKKVLYAKLLAFFTVVFIVFLVPIAASGFLAGLFGKSGIFMKIMKGTAFFSGKTGVLAALLVLNLTGLIVMSMRMFYSFEAIGVSAHFPNMLVLGSVVVISGMINITPSNLGIRESLITMVSTLFGVRTIDSAMASIVDRGVNFFVVVLTGVIFFAALFRKGLVPISAGEKK